MITEKRRTKQAVFFLNLDEVCWLVCPIVGVRIYVYSDAIMHPPYNPLARYETSLFLAGAAIAIPSHRIASHHHLYKYITVTLPPPLLIIRRHFLLSWLFQEMFSNRVYHEGFYECWPWFVSFCLRRHVLQLASDEINISGINSGNIHQWQKHEVWER